VSVPPNDLPLSRRTRAAPESAEIGAISREAVGYMRRLGGVDALPVGPHHFTFLERQDDAGSLPADLERCVAQGFAQRGLDARFSMG
jgi:hypothetical protein